jgi:DNA repair ATPase RecN
MDADWHAEAVECYERAQRDFEELRRKYNAEVDECERRAAVMIKRAEEIERLRAQRDALRQYITDYGSPADWNRIRRLYPELPPREET